MPYNLKIVLIEPQIPVNTGAIGRLCLATQSTLHLVKPMGFQITDTKLKRAGLDYWQHLQVVLHENSNSFFDSLPEKAPIVFFSTKARNIYYQHRFKEGSYLIFGNETNGISENILKDHPDRMFRIPHYDTRVRSLNLANVASIITYEAIRQLGP
ncbi:MAG: tRNA (cytidine(34)-2'-O)-methyltransferase [Nitrospinota bacterium]|nr:tRNA (cytidine(34)-2'-O)-methyltransferase [Nitrospinota bacterium]